MQSAYKYALSAYMNPSSDVIFSRFNSLRIKDIRDYVVISLFHILIKSFVVHIHHTGLLQAPRPGHFGGVWPELCQRTAYLYVNTSDIVYELKYNNGQSQLEKIPLLCDLTAGRGIYSIAIYRDTLYYNSGKNLFRVVPGIPGSCERVTVLPEQGPPITVWRRINTVGYLR